MKHKDGLNSILLNHFHRDTEFFDGFKLAREVCDLDWTDYPLAGITSGTACCWNSDSCVHIKCPGTAVYFMEDENDWKDECGPSRVSLMKKIIYYFFISLQYLYTYFIFHYDLGKFCSGIL